MSSADFDVDEHDSLPVVNAHRPPADPATFLQASSEMNRSKISVQRKKPDQDFNMPSGAPTGSEDFKSKKIPGGQRQARPMSPKREAQYRINDEDDLPSTRRKDNFEGLPTYRDEDNEVDDGMDISVSLQGSKKPSKPFTPLQQQQDTKHKHAATISADKNLKKIAGQPSLLSGSAKHTGSNPPVLDQIASFQSNELDFDSESRPSNARLLPGKDGKEKGKKKKLDSEFRSLGSPDSKQGEKVKLLPNGSSDLPKEIELPTVKVEEAKPPKPRKKEVKFTTSGLSSGPNVTSQPQEQRRISAHSQNAKDDQFVGYQYRYMRSLEKPELNLMPSYKVDPSDDLLGKSHEYKIDPKNDALYFNPPRSNGDIDQALFDYYARNTFIRQFNVDEDPSVETFSELMQKGKGLSRAVTMPRDETTIKDVRNIHLSSDHQRAYVWVITYTKSPGSVVISADQKRQLWLQVFSTSSAWASHSALPQSLTQKLEKLQQMREELHRLQTEFSKVSQIVQPEEIPKNSPNKSLVHQNNAIQNIMEKARKDSIRRQEILAQKQSELEIFETYVYKQMNLFDSGLLPDADSESKAFHMVSGYRSVHYEAPKDTQGPGSTPQSTCMQKPQLAEFSILIGEFDGPKHDYMHDPIQSYYKQFVSSEHALYFFKFPDESDIEQDIQDLASSSQIKSPESDSTAYETRAGRKEVSIKKPILYELSAFSGKCERVMVNDQPIQLPLDANTNQFSIIRPLDPTISREFSFLNTLMVAILKDKHVKAEPSAELLKQMEREQRASRRKSSKKPQLMGKLVESTVEIFSLHPDQQNTAQIGSNVDMREIPAEFDPKNISAFHKAEDSDFEDDTKPKSADFNFCCWYLIDKKQQVATFSVLVQKQHLLMRVPLENVRDPTLKVCVAKNLQFNPFDEESPFLKDFRLTQSMPVYAIELTNSVNFANLESFQTAAREARVVWERELANQPSKGYLMSVSAESYGLSLNDPKSKLNNLIESQENILRILDTQISQLYLAIQPRKNDIDFEVLYPILPDYFWSSADGARLRTEIGTKLLNQFKNYLEIEPTYQSFKDSGAESNSYANVYRKEVVGSITSFSPSAASGAQAKQGETLEEWTKDSISQCVHHHQIFFDEEEGLPSGTDLVGMTHFPSISDTFTSLLIQGSVKQNKKCVQHYMKDLLLKHPEIAKLNNKKGQKRSKSTGESMPDLRAYLKPPLASQKEQTTGRLKRANTIVAQTCGRTLTKARSLKSRFQFEKVVVSEDQKTFLHVIKFRKMYRVRRNNVGEIIRVLYKGAYREFEEDFEYFEYEIHLGHVDLPNTIHSLHSNEERNPTRKTAQLIHQFCAFDGQTPPLVSPFNRHQQLAMLTDHPDSRKQTRTGAFGITRSSAEGDESVPLATLQICLKEAHKLEPSYDLEAISMFKNLPAEKAFVEFGFKVDERRRFYFESIHQHNVIREIEWCRTNDQKMALIDFLNEQSKVKVWCPLQSPHTEDARKGNIKTIDFLTPIFQVYPKFRPTSRCIMDLNLPSEPQSWEILKNLFISKYQLTTIKQQNDEPRNLVLRLVPRRQDEAKLIVEPGKSAFTMSQSLLFVGRLNSDFETFEYLYVIRQTDESFHSYKDYKAGKRVLKPHARIVQPYDYVSFAKEFLAENNFISHESPLFCNKFPEQFMNVSLTAVDSSFGTAFGSEVELLAVRMWAPYNCVRLYTFDYVSLELTQVYEIPIPEDKLKKIVGLQLTRISDFELTYAVLIDWCSYKEVFQIRFEKKQLKKQSRYRYHTLYEVKGTLVGKMDLISPNLTDSCHQSGLELNYHPQQRVTMLPLEKHFSGELRRDGFSLLIDQERLDFDYLFFSNIPGRENCKYKYQSQSNVFEYEIQRSKKIKRNMNPTSKKDLEFYSLLVIKLRLREEMLKEKAFTEGQKMKLLRYFSKTIQAHSEVDYSNLYDTMVTRSDQISFAKLKRLIEPRSEFYGTTILAFKSLDKALIETAVDLLNLVIDRRIQSRENLLQENMTEELALEESPEGPQLFMKTSDRAIIAGWIPTLDSSVATFQQHQLDFFMSNMRFCEMDLNLMNPITWAMHSNCHNIAKMYANFFKQFAASTDNKDMIRDHAPIFYGSVRQLIELGILDMEEFLNPDGVGEDIGCELFQQTLNLPYLPQFHSDSASYTNEYNLSLEALERNMGTALGIKKVLNPSFMAQEQERENLAEVQYGLIDLDWMNTLNVFDQKPLHFLALQAQLKTGKRKKGEAIQFSFKKELARQQENQRPFLDYVANYRKMDIFTFESVKLLIDDAWQGIGYDFFKMQLWIFSLFFVLPFAVDLYHSYYVLHEGQMTLTHFVFNTMGLVTQFLFFFNELVQMRVKKTHISEYFLSLWNFNDISCFPIYLSLQIILWASVAEDEDNTKLSPETANAIRVFYIIVTLQTFVKLLFLVRIFGSVGFMMQMIGRVMRDLSTYFFFVLAFNALFAVMFMIMDTEIGDEYSDLWGPLRWMLFVYRNALQDFQISKTQGFLPEDFEDGASISERLADGNGFGLYLTWLVWLANSIVMTVVLLHLLIVVIGQSYEQFFGEMEAHVYKQRAELVVEAQEVLKELGYLKSKFYQRSVIVRKKKFCDDVADRLDKDKWQGITFALKNYLQFCLIHKIDTIEDQNQLQKRRTTAQIFALQKGISDLARKVDSVGSQMKTFIDQDGEDSVASKITYQGNLNNISQ